MLALIIVQVEFGVSKDLASVYRIVHACLDLIALSAGYTPLPSVTLVSRRA